MTIMSEHDETLRKALEENARLRSEREETLREASSAEFAGRLRFAERIYAIYAIGCVVVGVAAINFFLFAPTYDMKTMIGCAVLILVIYETTVLMKLWFATAAMKMSVLKEVKLLRYEVARLGQAVGVDQPAEPSPRYEPLQGASKWERRVWLAICVVVAMATSSWSTQKFASETKSVVDKTTVTLDADGGATSVTEMEQPYHLLSFPSRQFPFYAPKDCRVRFVDPQGEEIPIKVTETDGHTRHDVTLTDAVFVNGKMQYTRIIKSPKAATLADGVWTYKNDIMYSTQQNHFTVTVRLPRGAEVVSAEPKINFEVDEDGRTAVRFQGTRGRNEKFAYSIRYRIPE